MDDFFTKKTCDRCRGPLGGLRTMSRFNTDCLCEKCAAEERKHPDYRKALEAERAAVSRGETDFPGIGWPGKDGRV